MGYCILEKRPEKKIAYITLNRPEKLNAIQPGDIHELIKLLNDIEQDEDVLSYALFPQVALKYFQYRQAEKYKIDNSLVDKDQKTYPV